MSENKKLSERYENFETGGHCHFYYDSNPNLDWYEIFKKEGYIHKNLLALYYINEPSSKLVEISLFMNDVTSDYYVELVV